MVAVLIKAPKHGHKGLKKNSLCLFFAGPVPLARWTSNPTNVKQRSLSVKFLTCNAHRQCGENPVHILV